MIIPSDIKVSIIVPVYNGENYLQRCLDSLVHQSLNELEILIVNDGSTDNSVKLIEKYTMKHENIILINQENQGQGAARNKALKRAKGKYILFVDSDDYIENNTAEFLYGTSEKNSLDLIIYNWIFETSEGNIFNVISHPEYDGKEIPINQRISCFLTDPNMLIEGFSWNKFIKRSLILDNNIFYPNTLFEDIPTMFRVLMKAKKSMYVDRKFYHYIRNEHSTVHSFSTKKVEGYIAAVKNIGEILLSEGKKEEFSKEYFNYRATYLLRQYGELLLNGDLNKSLRRRFKIELQPITIQNYIKNHEKDKKLFVKILIYQLGLMRPFFYVYHKFKPIF